MNITLHDRRNLNKLNLDTYPMDLNNNFDYSADQIIKKLMEVNKQIWSEIERYQNDLEEDSEKKRKAEQFFKTYGIAIDSRLADFELDIMYRTEEMVTVLEMKILYAFKHVEINMKRLISAAYPKINNKDFDKWGNFIQFLKSKSIDHEKLDCYKEINELRLANNAIKHSISSLVELKSIPEFKNHSAISFNILYNFYNRVRTAPNKFLTSLSSAIYEELYHFNDEKIDSIVQDLVLRMDKTIAERFLERMQSHYI